MKINKVEAAATLIAILVAIFTMTVPAFADSGSPAVAQSLTFTSQPWIEVVNSSASYLAVTYHNQSPDQVNGTIYAVVHNTLGQTVQISTQQISGIAPGQNATAVLPLSLPLDSYGVDVFVLSSGGWVISTTTNSTVVA